MNEQIFEGNDTERIQEISEKILDTAQEEEQIFTEFWKLILILIHLHLCIQLRIS